MFGSARQDECAQDMTAFEAEAMPHLKRLFRLAAWLTPDRIGAEELVQETLVLALASIKQLEGESDACVWLIRIMYQVKGKPSARWRSWGKHRAIGGISDDRKITAVVSFEPRTPQDVTEEEVSGALRCLPPELREVILLSNVEDLSYKEAADVLGITVGVVMMRLARGRKMLRANLRATVDRRGNASDERIARAFTAERGGTNAVL